MNREVEVIDLGLGAYQEVWDIQEKYFQEVLALKKHKKDEPVDTPNRLIFVEHPHVFTLGKSGDEHNLLVNYIQLQAKHAEFVKTNRGGDITYHGPGQIVGYPILDLENFNLGLRGYIELIEEAVIKTIAEYGIVGNRDSKATGVWLDTDIPLKMRKICAIGVRASRFVSMHGFALNVNTDLNYFNLINPCGFQDRGVTSLQKELGYEVDITEVKQKLEKHIKSLLLALASCVED
ncbi:lipoyl(octanoyl) transferase LipB [Halosquirtibacter laminarini]|uniref:Lipoyl(Octanoyl) transferase LipB n=1 Tax=Halosquirtibacter laminarini TaxID=3374600 RepID=A0AC61NHW7_9BACT|nr:lipoyl(octanoyl) transferase LipB [Prolixibacteraceae bacterium]